MPSNFEIASIILLVVNIALTIWCLSKKNSEEDYSENARNQAMAAQKAALARRT